MKESFLTSQGQKRKHYIKIKNTGTASRGGNVQKPDGEADQERYGDDGTDRKKKEGRREERKGVLKKE